MATEIERLLGPELTIKNGTNKPTASALKGKEIVGLYFSASWCPSCVVFTPEFADFYNTSAAEGKLEIVFVSSDRDVPSFSEYYGKMPWLAIPFKPGSTEIKDSLAKSLQVKGIPKLVLLDAKTGHFITDGARHDIVKAGTDKEKRKQLIASWKAKKAVPLDQAVFDLGAPKPSLIGRFIGYFLKNPLMLVGLYYIIRKILRQLRDEGEEEPGEEL